MKNSCRFAKFGSGMIAVVTLAVAGCASKAPAPVEERGAPRAAATAPASKDTYVVKSGDTLYSIARDHNMDFRELIALNGIDSPNRITPGKVLKVRPPVDPNAAGSAVASTAPVTSDVVVSRPIGDTSAVPAPPASTNNELLKRTPKAGKEPYSDQALAQAQGQSKPAEPPAPQPAPEPRPADAVPANDELSLIWPASGKVIGSYSEAGNKGIDIAGKTGDPVIAASAGRVLIANNALRGYGNMVIVKVNNEFVTVYAHNSKLLVKEGQNVTKGQKIAEMGSSDADQVKLHFEVRRQGKPVDPTKYLPQR